MTILLIQDQQWKPNLFIAGFNKCGTTEFCDYLSQHPDIFLPFEKEPNTFWDLANYPACFLGHRTGNSGHLHYIMNLKDYHKMFSKGRRYRYRIDGTVSYTFDPKFSRILKSFSENAKVILLIRDQTHRLVSMYFHSFLIHKENDFGKWLNDYFIPYIETYLYYDKVAAYYHEFGQDNNNLRIIETKNLSSEDVHKQIFEYLELKPIKIIIRHKNPNLVGPEDSKAYRQLILTLTSIKLRTLGAAQRVGFENEANRVWYMIGDLARQILKRNRNKNNYTDITKLIPLDVSSIFEKDYGKSLNFAVQHKIMIRPTSQNTQEAYSS
jgi:hypothetical protein